MLFRSKGVIQHNSRCLQTKHFQFCNKLRQPKASKHKVFKRALHQCFRKLRLPPIVQGIHLVVLNKLGINLQLIAEDEEPPDKSLTLNF